MLHCCSVAVWACWQQSELTRPLSVPRPEALRLLATKRQNMNDATSQGDASTWEDFEARDKTNLAALPDAVRAIVEECRTQSKPASAGKGGLTVDGEEVPYPCRMYEAVPGEEELLQLQWMRIDVSIY